ncbi:hypothetical protein BC830DRAFT_1105323 [Chytriomyces sp. MP71]|nr:hypothetical protein BC830DRAFT_1105323 [Chytriomyces sp. MP71]
MWKVINVLVTHCAFLAVTILYGSFLYLLWWGLKTAQNNLIPFPPSVATGLMLVPTTLEILGFIGFCKFEYHGWTIIRVMVVTFVSLAVCPIIWSSITFLYAPAYTRAIYLISIVLHTYSRTFLRILVSQGWSSLKLQLKTVAKVAILPILGLVFPNLIATGVIEAIYTSSGVALVGPIISLIVLPVFQILYATFTTMAVKKVNQKKEFLHINQAGNPVLVLTLIKLIRLLDVNTNLAIVHTLNVFSLISTKFIPRMILLFKYVHRRDANVEPFPLDTNNHDRPEPQVIITCADGDAELPLPPKDAVSPKSLDTKSVSNLTEKLGAAALNQRDIHKSSSVSSISLSDAAVSITSILSSAQANVAEDVLGEDDERMNTMRCDEVFRDLICTVAAGTAALVFYTDFVQAELDIEQVGLHFASLVATSTFIEIITLAIESKYGLSRYTFSSLESYIQVALLATVVGSVASSIQGAQRLY